MAHAAMPAPICLRWELHVTVWLRSSAICTDGKISAMRIAMMAITTSNSVNVNAPRRPGRVMKILNEELLRARCDAQTKESEVIPGERVKFCECAAGPRERCLEIVPRNQVRGDLQLVLKAGGRRPRYLHVGSNLRQL